MRLLVLGATGRTGREVVRQALAAGHDVTAFVRDPARLAGPDSRLSVVTGDVRNADDLQRALTGQEAAISTLGSRMKDDLLNSLSGKPDRTMRRSSEALIQAAGVAGVRRIVVLSTFMLAANFKAGLLKPLTPLYRAMCDDKRAGEEALKNSSLDWTIVYATRLTDGGRSGHERLVPVTETVTPRNTVSRSDVAAFLLAQLNDDAGVRKSLVLTAA